MKKSPKREPLGISPFEARWKRRSGEYADIQVIELADAVLEQDPAPAKETRFPLKPAPVESQTLQFADVAVLHLALTRQYQRTASDSVADHYENLLNKLETIMETRPRVVRFE